MNIIELAKDAGFIVTGSRIESPYIGGSDISHRLAEFAALVRAEYEKPLKLAEEALASIAFEKPSPVTVESLADIAFKALRAIREALAEPVKQEPKCSMSKHTPGPWKVGKYLGQGGWVVHMDVVDRGRGMDIVHGVAGLDNDERLANARLIAAAPDLLKAFSDVYLELAWDHLPPAKKYLAENARAAIAKATGGAEHEKTKPVCETCESLARTVMMDQTGKA